MLKGYHAIKVKMSHPLLLMFEKKELFLGLRRLQNRSLLEVNEDFGDKYNDKRAFLVNLFYFQQPLFGQPTDATYIVEAAPPSPLKSPTRA